MPSKDNLYNGRKGIGFENPSYFEKAKDLRPTLYDEKVIGLENTPMFLTHSNEALEIKKFKISRENKIEFAYDYGNLNASYVNEKINLEDDYFQEIINPDVEKIDSPKRRKIKSSKQNVKQVDNDVSRANNDFVHFSDLDTFSSVRRPKNSGVIWKKKGSSNTSNVGLSADCVSNLNKNVKRYSRKDLLACNISHLGETRSVFVCNDAMNVSCDSRMNDFLDDNNFFIFDDVNVRISPVSKMPFRKKPSNSMKVRSKSNMIKSLPRTVHKWLLKFQPLAEPVAKWFPRIVQICLWIIDSGCSKHMTGNRALLTNFVEKFLGTVRFGNNDFAVIAGYEDVVIERRNRTLVEAARTMLTFANLPSFLWTEAIATACFTQNHSIIYKCFDKTPYELINKRKPNIKFFCVFGCRCYLFNDYEDVGKLKAKGDIRVFVGYSKEFVAFRIYNKRTRKIHESMNVNFDEISEMAFKQFSLEPGLTNLNETRKSSNPSVLNVDEASKKDLEDLFQDFYD
nr:retrovirus-related Pol polyprotein from transposon TNT 1-94 [Tanacetum cinerariifolium]